MPITPVAPARKILTTRPAEVGSAEVGGRPSRAHRRRPPAPAAEGRTAPRRDAARGRALSETRVRPGAQHHLRPAADDDAAGPVYRGRGGPTGRAEPASELAPCRRARRRGGAVPARGLV